MDEVKFVYRQESFNDLAVRELAKSQAMCLCKIQYKRCKKSMCATCSSHQRVQNCKNAMNDYDRERLHNYMLLYYNEYSKNPMAWMNHKQYVWSYFKFVFTLIVMMFLILGSIAILGEI